MFHYRCGVLSPDYVKRQWKILSECKWFEDANRKLERFQFGAFRGTGNNFRTSVASLKKPSDKISSNTAGNGAAMRCAPLAVAHYFHQSHMGLVNDVLANCLLTHTNMYAVAPTFAISYMLCRYLKENEYVK